MKLRSLTWTVAALTVVACGSSSKQSRSATSAAAKGDKTLYERLGGRPAITAVVDQFTANVAADKRINARFINTDIPRLKTLLVEFVSMATGGPGGPQQYEGRDMHTAHASMQLVDEEFTALVEDLAAALDKLGVPAKEKGELLGALGPLKPQIVNPPSAEAQKFNPALLQKGKTMVATLHKSGKTEPADLLDTALTARARGQRNYAEQLFSIVELQTEPGWLAPIAPLFRQGAPERIATKLRTMPKDTPPQPKGVVGASDEEDEKDKEKPRHAALSGMVNIDGAPTAGRLAVITLTPVSGKYARRSPKQRIIEQRDREFAPHVMMVPAGSTVAFPNFDPVFHNVFSLSPTRPFDLGIYKNGETRDVTFDKEGILRIGCNLHANMSAYLVVVGAPHYVVTDANGKFRFRSLAPGKYKLRAWSETSTEPLTEVVDVKDGDNSITVEVKGGARAELGTDKFGDPRSPSP